MNRFLRALVLLCAGVLLWLAGDAAGSPLPDVMTLGKVSPWVLNATENGAKTDLLVVLAEQVDLGPAYRLPTKEARGRWVYESLWTTAQRSQVSLRAWLDAESTVYRPYYVVNLLHVQGGDRSLVERLAARPDVGRIEANPSIRNTLPQLPEGPEMSEPQAIEWNISHVGAPDVWAMGYSGQGIVVGGQDTGYDWDHPALVQHYRGWNGSSADHDYSWHDAIHTGGGVCGADSAEPCDDNNHGTHTMGTVLGDDGGSNQIGMAPGAEWIGCRNMNQGVGTPATYLECFEFFLAPYPVGGDPGQGNPVLAPDVTNNSWSCPASEGCSWDTLQAAIEAQRAAGIMTVVSAGNEGPSCSSVAEPPGIYDAAYSVGATSSSDIIASFSSRGPVMVDGSGRLKPDISAPGVSIRSSVPGGGYQGGWQGTSMASPHVAGAVALLWSAQPALRNDLDLTEDVLNHAAVPRYSTLCGDPANAVPNNVYGWGRLDILAAVQDALALKPGLGISKVSTEEHPPAGLPFEYTLTVTKTGGPATAVTVSDTLPADTLFGWASDGGHLVGDEVVWSGLSLPLDGEMMLTYGVTVTCIPSGTEIVNDRYAVRAAEWPTPTHGAPLTVTSAAAFALADFSHPNPVALDWPVPFTNQSQGVTAYEWNFGDGQGSTDKDPSHTYTEALGDYTVVLTATNACTFSVASRLLTVADFGVTASPPASAQEADVGETVSYTFWVTNEGTIRDTIQLATIGQDWPMAFSADQWTLDPGEGAPLTVEVTVPVDSGGGEQDAITVDFRSLSDPRSPAASASVDLTTTARVIYGLELAGPLDAQNGLPGEVVAYTLMVTNTSNVADTISFERITPGWTTAIFPPSLTIARDGWRTLTVNVTVPVTVVGGSEDLAVIRATGSGSQVEATLTTTALWQVYLPLLVKSAP